MPCYMISNSTSINMLKIYLDWNVITHLKEEKHRELYDFIMQHNDKFIFPYSKAHLKDLLVSKSDDNLYYYNQDIHLLSSICKHHLLEYEANINSPYPYRCTPNEYFEINGSELDLFNSGFSKDAFLNCLQNKGIETNAFIADLENQAIEPIVIPIINIKIHNMYELISTMFEYGEHMMKNKSLPKEIKQYIQATTDKLQYKAIQGANPNNVFDKLNIVTSSQTSKTFIDILEKQILEGSKSNIELFTLLYISLNFSGYQSDTNRNLQNIYTDAEHAYYASSCDIFVSNDSRLRSKSTAIYNSYNIPTKIITTNELIQLMESELSLEYDLSHMFNEVLPLYGVPRIDGDNNIYRQLPFRFLGLFNYCIKADMPNINTTTGIFRIVISPRDYVFYSELEHFFELIIQIITDNKQKESFKELFVEKFLSQDKQAIKDAEFTIDCEDFLLQLVADFESHIPLPMIFLTHKRQITHNN